jgi:hypothetical protein
MGFCSFIEKRCNRFYFRMRLPVDIAALIDRSHVVASLQTGDLRLTKHRPGWGHADQDREHAGVGRHRL